MNKKNFFRYFAGTGLLVISSMVLSCSMSSGSTSGTNSSKNNSSSANKSETTADKSDNKNSAEPDDSNRDLSPLTLGSSALFSGNYRMIGEASDFESKYKDRTLTVSNMYLWELDSSKIRATDRSDGNGGNFIECEGDFGAYYSVSDKIKQFKEQKKPIRATLKGKVREARVFNSEQLEVTMGSCTLVEIGK